MKTMRSLTIPFLLALSACSLTPALDKPAPPVPAALPAVAGVETHALAVEPEWRTLFGDRRLRRLVELALANNRDLRLAALNTETVQAQYGIQRAARLPAIDATGGVTRQRTTTSRSSRVECVPSIPELDTASRLVRTRLSRYGARRSSASASMRARAQLATSLRAGTGPSGIASSGDGGGTMP